MKHLLFICSTSDASGQIQEECLDAALTCVAMGLKTEINFNAAALKSSTEAVTHKMEMANQFGVTIYFSTNNEDEHLDHQITPKKLFEGMTQFDHIIHF